MITAPRVRIAPSPTGEPHVGTAYMALFNMIFARHFNGTFILRIEDTDQSRSRPEYETSVMDALNWLNISWDEGPDCGGEYGPYRQSERTHIYQKYAQELLDKGHAYKCFATEEELIEMREIAKKMGKQIGYDRRYRNLSEQEIKKRIDDGESYVVRLKVPLTGECTYHDTVKGSITFPYADLDDQVLLKSDGFPTYHLANVVDDYCMKITHVIRGDEWMSSTPKHILLYEYFGWEPPTFLHMPLLLGSDGRKLSKRRSPTSIFYFKESGYLRDAFINFLTLMGYSMKSGQEVYSLDEIIKDFDPKRIGSSSAFFDSKKLDWINQHYLIHDASDSQILNHLKEWSLNDAYIASIIPLAKTRMKTLGEFFELSSFLFVNTLSLSHDLLCPKGISPKVSSAILHVILARLDEEGSWARDVFFKISQDVAKDFSLNHKKVVMKVLFAALEGSHQGLPLFDSFVILGKSRTRVRLLESIEFLGGLSKKDISKIEKASNGDTLSQLFSDDE